MDIADLEAFVIVAESKSVKLAGEANEFESIGCYTKASGHRKPLWAPFLIHREAPT